MIALEPGRLPRPARRPGTVAALLVATLLAASVFGCDERAAREKLEAALSDSEQVPLVQLEARLEDIVERWPRTDAAARARRELEWVRELQTAHARGRWRAAVDAARRVAAAAERFRLERGAYPHAANELFPDFLDGPLRDPWGEDVLYRRTGDGYTVVSLGADGLPGGVGPERDVVIETGELRAGTAPR